MRLGRAGFATLDPETLIVDGKEPNWLRDIDFNADIDFNPDRRDTLKKCRAATPYGAQLPHPPEPQPTNKMAGS